MRGPHVVLDRVRARDRFGDRGKPRGQLHAASITLGAGVYAVVGAPEDGTWALHEVLTGALAPSGGRLLVDGRAPFRDALVRSRMAVLAVRPDLPPAPRVDAAVAFALTARGDASTRAADVLARVGISSLAARPVASLGPAERRAVDLALALTVPSPVLVALHEPLLDVTAAAREATVELLRAAAASSACAVITTSSHREAEQLDAVVIDLVAGRFAQAGGREPASALEATCAEIRPDLGGRALREVTRTLAGRPEIASLEWRFDPAGHRATLRLGGPDLEACAVALFEAAAATDVTVTSLGALPTSARLAPRAPAPQPAPAPQVAQHLAPQLAPAPQPAPAPAPTPTPDPDSLDAAASAELAVAAPAPAPAPASDTEKPS